MGMCVCDVHVGVCWVCVCVMGMWVCGGYGYVGGCWVCGCVMGMWVCAGYVGGVGYVGV